MNLIVTLTLFCLTVLVATLLRYIWLSVFEIENLLRKEDKNEAMRLFVISISQHTQSTRDAVRDVLAAIEVTNQRLLELNYSQTAALTEEQRDSLQASPIKLTGAAKKAYRREMRKCASPHLRAVKEPKEKPLKKDKS